MFFLKNNRRFSFSYGKKEIKENDYDVEVKENGNELITVYNFSDGLRITNIAKKIDKFGAYEWVNWLENTGDKESQIISDLWDADFAMPLGREEENKPSAFIPDSDEITKVYNPNGSDCTSYEFNSQPDYNFENRALNYLKSGQSKEYGSTDGRSSDNNCAPFFNVHKAGKGFLCAVGWTGQWHAKIERLDEEVVFKSGIPDVNFRLYPGEKIRTSSIVVLPYEASVIDSQNLWRRLVKEEYSLIGSENRDKYGPFCAGVWGGMRTESVLERINKIKENNLPFEYVWMDAGWYGIDTKPTPDEFEGDWAEHTGDWRVSPIAHPGGLKDVSKAVHDAGMKFLLWFEPERVKKNTPTALEHPEYFIGVADENDSNLFLNLGNEDAWNYIYNTLSNLIEELNLDFYRQDANFQPIYVWYRNDDRADRLGITQIKYIMGMYRLWDTLLERFPYLGIDNCASGGRRIDIETLRRSIPLWRSDYQCPANFNINGTLSHHLSFNSWMPYSGTGTGRAYDEYRVRCSYDSAMTTNYSFSEKEAFCDTPEKVEFIRKYGCEYLMLRPYFSEDFYPLTEITDKSDVWTAVQFDRPAENDGIVQVFKRENSPCLSALFDLYAINENAEYTFTDIDDNSKFVISGKELKEKGFGIEIKERRTAKIFMYSYK